MPARFSAVIVCLFFFVPRVFADPPDAWVATWAASQHPANPAVDEPLLKIDDQTVRERVRISVGGDRIRLRLSNEFGPKPLLVGSVTVGIPDDPASVKPGSIRSVTFGGRTSVTIPAWAPVLSDPVDFPVAFGSEISISLHLPGRVATPTMHALALKRAVVSKRGDYARAQKIEATATSESSILLGAALVPARPSQRLVVAFGDSVTDGDGSTVDADQNWPSHFIRRLGQTPDGKGVAVVNAGLVGNRLLSDGFVPGWGVSALARFDHDALALPEVTHVIVFEGINDICFPGAQLNGRFLAHPADVRTADDVIGAYRQLIGRAHAQRVKLIGATITPCAGVTFPGYYSANKEQIRQVVNKWIRTSGAFDGVIDFDAALRDPKDPSRLLPRFASDDHLHPNDAGYRAMAEAIDLSLFK